MELKPQDFGLGKRLLARLQGGEITMAEFEKEIAYFALTTGFEEFIPCQEPPKPTELLQYLELPPKQKEKMGMEFWHQPDIQGYLRARSDTNAWNRGCIHWLKEIGDRFTSYGDTVNASKVSERLKEFEVFFQ